MYVIEMTQIPVETLEEIQIDRGIRHKDLVRADKTIIDQMVKEIRRTVMKTGDLRTTPKHGLKTSKRINPSLPG